MGTSKLLQGKHAVVIGGGGSIGSAVATEFASQGADVFLAGRTLTNLESVGGVYGSRGRLSLAMRVSVERFTLACDPRFALQPGSDQASHDATRRVVFLRAVCCNSAWRRSVSLNEIVRRFLTSSDTQRVSDACEGG